MESKTTSTAAVDTMAEEGKSSQQHHNHHQRISVKRPAAEKGDGEDDDEGDGDGDGDEEAEGRSSPRTQEIRGEISKKVVELLAPYRTEKCTQGRIKSKDDFKHLARKVMAVLRLSFVFDGS